MLQQHDAYANRGMNVTALWSARTCSLPSFDILCHTAKRDLKSLTCQVACKDVERTHYRQTLSWPSYIQSTTRCIPHKPCWQPLIGQHSVPGTRDRFRSCNRLHVHRPVSYHIIAEASQVKALGSRGHSARVRNHAVVCCFRHDCSPHL